jgi:large conductance mechanosensitive channel
VTATTLAAAREQGAVFAYGNFITVLINFLILAWIIFLMIKGVNRMRTSLEKEKAEGAAEPAPPPEDVLLLTEIRDLLKSRPAV